MANEIKDENFTAEFGKTYSVDTSLGEIIATLPDPTGNEGKDIGFINEGDNPIAFSGYPIKGVTGLKLPSWGDYIQIMVFEGLYIIMQSSGIYTSPTKSWKINIDDSGVITAVQTNV